jgi:hypothetical protein
MPNTKISALTSATTPLAGTEVLPVVQSSTTTQVSVENLTAGRAVSALNFSVTGATIPTNGIYLSATNSLGTSTNGTLRSTYDASGNFSVGTLSATGRITAGALRTTSSGEFLGGINSLDTTTGGAAGVGGVVTFSGDTQGAGYKQFAAVLGGKENSTLTDVAGYLAFYTRPAGGNLTERARFDRLGNLGVGITSPQARLQVLDTLKISNAGQSQGSLILGDGSSTSFNVGLARWNGVTNAPGTGGMGYFAQGSTNGGGHYFYTDDAAVGSMTLRVSISPAVGDLKILTGNVIINTAAKGITTASAISLNFGTNTSTTGMTLDTSNNLNVLGSYTANSVAVPTISSTSTLTNKRVTPRVSITTSSATPTINTDSVDVYGLTAQAVDITSFSTNLSGTPTDGQLLRIYIVGTAARAITWGASFEASTTPLPTTTVTTNRLDVGFVWNAATSKWRCLASA